MRRVVRGGCGVGVQRHCNMVEDSDSLRDGVDHRAFFFQAEDGIRDLTVTGVQTCALPISAITTPAAPTREHRPGAPRKKSARTPLTTSTPIETYSNSMIDPVACPQSALLQIGRASCRERV